MSNRLRHETSPYLLQHRENPVDWYPWCEEAFQRARDEDKPVFLSIGYSTCHWCHVMAHESFEDPEIAALLNRHFISIKVDKEERPDIDSIYMAVCQAFTGSGGWPTSIFMTAEQKPFFAGTYFPKTGWGGRVGFRELLELIAERWESDRGVLVEQAEAIVAALRQQERAETTAEEALLQKAVDQYRRSFDRENGGFGAAPKFPVPHNLLFLMTYYQRYGDAFALEMAERTLVQMYRGGLFDHIGYGFCRYSTDRRYLVPHFEKMLYDNALLILAYAKAYAVTKKPLYLEIGEKTAAYVLRELTDPAGGFYSAQDADSDGEEGKYYVFTPGEITELLGEETGAAFNQHFAITEAGNFEGKSIPNLLHSDPAEGGFDDSLPRLRQYRRKRCALHLDDKVLTLWNGLMIAALCQLYRCSQNSLYLSAAQKANRFIEENLCQGDTLFVSYRAGKRGVTGFLGDYAAWIFAQLALYEATLEKGYLARAEELCRRAVDGFWDEERGGFYLYEARSEALILRPKETYDGAIPSENSLMAWNLVRLEQLTGRYEELCRRQLDFLSADAERYPTGYGMYLLALLDYCRPPMQITAVLRDPAERFSPPADAVLRLLEEPTEEFPLKNGKTTFYVCRDHSCRPPVNDLDAVL